MDEIFDIIASFCIPRLQKWIVRGSRPTSSLTFLTPSIKRCRLFPTCLKREQGIEPPVFIAGKLVYGKMVIKLYMPRCWSSLDQGQTRFQHSSAAYLQTHLPMPINQIVVSVITTVVFRFGRILVRSISIFITVCVAMGFGMLWALECCVTVTILIHRFKKSRSYRRSSIRENRASHQFVETGTLWKAETSSTKHIDKYSLHQNGTPG